jgi:hypothetical protein
MKYDNAHRTKEACSELFPSCIKDVDVSWCSSSYERQTEFPYAIKY